MPAAATKPWEDLRKPFEPGQIGKLPRVTCGACRDAQRKVCDRHEKRECGDCKNWISTAHIHLDYVGHAAVTDRLLQVDHEWDWEPLASTPEGLPLFDAQNGLWIKLTVLGVTRLGYGDAQGKRGPDAVKEVIGDALRNAAMRFGVALDLWSKGDLAPGNFDSQPEPERVIGNGAPPKTSGRDWKAEADAATSVDKVRALWAEAGGLGELTEQLKAMFTARGAELAKPPEPDSEMDKAMKALQEGLGATPLEPPS